MDREYQQAITKKKKETQTARCLTSLKIDKK